MYRTKKNKVQYIASNKFIKCDKDVAWIKIVECNTLCGEKLSGVINKFMRCNKDIT
jgi:hypothetical protein